MELQIAFSGTDLSDCCIYYLDSEEHATDFGQVEKLLGKRGGSIRCMVVRVVVGSWDNDLTPWQAHNIYREGEDFGGQADLFLSNLVNRAIPSFERERGLAPSKRIVMGYSLAGLCSLYALLTLDGFDGAVCMSASLWYEGFGNWVEKRLSGNDSALEGKCAVFTLGSKEKRASPPLVKTVESETTRIVDLLGAHGVRTSLDIVPGGHMSNYVERHALAIERLRQALA